MRTHTASKCSSATSGMFARLNSGGPDTGEETRLMDPVLAWLLSSCFKTVWNRIRSCFSYTEPACFR